CRREAHLNFLETAFYQRLEELKFLADVHGHREGLVAIPKVHTAPDRGMRDRLFRPLAVGEGGTGEGAGFGRGVFHYRWAVCCYHRSAAGQIKNPPPDWRWGLVNVYATKLEPHCRAAQQQRV